MQSQRGRCPECNGPFARGDGKTPCDQCRSAWQLVENEAGAAARDAWWEIRRQFDPVTMDPWLSQLRAVTIRDRELVLMGFWRVRRWIGMRYSEKMAGMHPELEKVEIASPRVAAAILRRKQINERSKSDA